MEKIKIVKIRSENLAENFQSLFLKLINLKNLFFKMKPKPENVEHRSQKPKL